MRIIYDGQVFTFQEYGGVSRYFVEITRAINKCESNASASILTFGNICCYLLRNDKKRSEAYKRIMKSRFGWPLVRWLNRMVINIYSRKDVVIVHPTGYDTYLLKRKKYKIVCTIYDMTHELYPELFTSKAASNYVEGKKRYLYESDLIVCISENTKKDILDIYPDVDEKKIRVVYLGNSMNPMKMSEEDDLEPYILFVGGRSGYKNFSLVLEALRLLNAEGLGERVFLKCVGGAFSSEELNRINELGLNDLVWHESASDNRLADLYNRAMCFVYPSKYEGFGIPILEAWSSKCPVVLSTSSCFSEIAGAAALYFEEDDAVGLYNCIQQLRFDLRKRYELIELGEQRLECYSWQKSAEQMIEIYNEVI